MVTWGYITCLILIVSLFSRVRTECNVLLGIGCVTKVNSYYLGDFKWDKVCSKQSTLQELRDCLEAIGCSETFEANVNLASDTLDVYDAYCGPGCSDQAAQRNAINNCYFLNSDWTCRHTQQMVECMAENVGGCEGFRQEFLNPANVSLYASRPGDKYACTLYLYGQETTCLNVTLREKGRHQCVADLLQDNTCSGIQSYLDCLFQQTNGCEHLKRQYLSEEHLDLYISGYSRCHLTLDGRVLNKPDFCGGGLEELKFCGENHLPGPGITAYIDVDFFRLFDAQESFCREASNLNYITLRDCYKSVEGSYANCSFSLSNNLDIMELLCQSECANAALKANNIRTCSGRPTQQEAAASSLILKANRKLERECRVLEQRESNIKTCKKNEIGQCSPLEMFNERVTLPTENLQPHEIINPVDKALWICKNGEAIPTTTTTTTTSPVTAMNNETVDELTTKQTKTTAKKNVNSANVKSKANKDFSGWQFTLFSAFFVAMMHG